MLLRFSGFFVFFSFVATPPRAHQMRRALCGRLRKEVFPISVTVSSHLTARQLIKGDLGEG